jgi:uncharacterized membrane protein
LSQDTLNGPPNKFTPPAQSPWALSTRRIVTVGILVGITFLMAYTPIGYIPVPIPVVGAATTLHLPVIVAAILEGPLAGMITGFFFGLTSFLQAGNALFKDPLIAFGPRILIGLTSWLAFVSLQHFNRDWAAALAGAVGSATNTIFVLGLAYWRGYLPLPFILAIIPQALLELIAAVIVAFLVVRAYGAVRGRLVRARETRPREKLPY